MTAVTLQEVPERYNACDILDHNLEAGRGDKVALHCGSDTLT